MADQMSEPLPMSVGPTGTIAGGPGRAIRCWVALFLRVGVGLSLLSTGLSGYFGQQGRPFGGGGGGGPWGQNLPFAGLDPFFSALPYFAIGIGLALILGFLTTASSIASASFSLVMPVLAIIQVVAAGASGANPGNRWGNDPFTSMMMSMLLPGLVPQAALIWFSPLENHPYSVDALVFGRNEVEASPAAPGPARPGPLARVPEPEPEPTIIAGE